MNVRLDDVVPGLVLVRFEYQGIKGRVQGGFYLGRHFLIFVCGLSALPIGLAIGIETPEFSKQVGVFRQRRYGL